MLYTGGTTGMPKGVMWRQDDLLISLDVGSKHPLPAEPGWDAFDRRIAKPGPRHLPAAPLMHGTGAFGAMWGLVIGGTIVMLEGRHFDPVELLDTIEARRVNGMTIVGDAFAKPVLALLDAEPDAVGHLLAAVRAVERGDVVEREPSAACCDTTSG